MVVADLVAQLYDRRDSEIGIRAKRERKEGEGEGNAERREQGYTSIRRSE